MDWCSENEQQNQNREEKGLAAAAAVTQAARARKAGCLPPFIGQSGESGAPAAKREEPNCPSGKHCHGKSYHGEVTLYYSNRFSASQKSLSLQSHLLNF
jgi:hypothetical protein